ncbi:MAG TPA: sugar ABC transporter permease [Methylomirabilota bacterium]|jgi:ABC-type sugar transport system permease subunit|nr:sugar ABC transporter permease [Methylomirabilota bacterium]
MPTTIAEVRAGKAALPARGRAGPGALAQWLGPDYRLGYLFVGPIVLLVLALVAYPFGYAVYLSLTRKYVGMPPVFVGLENYVRLTFDGFFRRAVANSVIFTGSSVGLKLLLGMGMALVLASRIRWRSFWTGVLLIPWVAPTVVSALNFLWIYDYSLGVLNYLLVQVLRILPRGVGWLSEPGTAMASVIAVNVWRGFPFFGISFLAGMKAIPGELYEAAAVDGASPAQRFRHVTLPGIRNIVIIVMLLSTIWTFNDFTIIYILTKGGPGGATQVLPVLTYEIAFGAQRLGEAIAVALYMLPALAVVIIVLARHMQRGRR